MTTASLAPQTTSDGSIATHCTISIVSTLVTPNLATTRMSHCLPRPLTLILQMTSKFLCSYKFHALSYHAPTFNTPPLSLPTPPIGSLPLVVGYRIFPLLVLDKEILNSPHFLIPLIKSETQRCYTILTPCPHFLEQNNQEQNDATAANPEVITRYCSRTTLLPQQAKEKFMPPLILNTNFIKKDFIFDFPGNRT